MHSVTIFVMSCSAPQGIHHQYQDPLAFRPERFMPGGEYEQFPEDIRPYYVSSVHC